MSSQPDPLTAARRAITRAGFGEPVTTSGGGVEVVCPPSAGPGNRRLLRDELRLAGLEPRPTVSGDGFVVEGR